MAKDCRGATVGVGDALSLWNEREAPVPPASGKVMAIVDGEVVVGYGNRRAVRIPEDEFAGFNWVKWTEADGEAWAEFLRERAEAEEARSRDSERNLSISPGDYA